MSPQRALEHNQGTEDNEFFQSLPYRNFFQYPPMQPIKPGEQPVTAAALGLSEPLADKDFTIFVSIPFCRVRCNSCPYFVALLPVRENPEVFLDKYLARVERQLFQYAATPRFASGRCRAVYLGGGTASLLSPQQIEKMVGLLKASFALPEDVEITLEGNPHEFTGEYLKGVRRAGITRVSLGYQSSQETVLREMINSPHSAHESLQALESALAIGFNTVNVDLLYGLPGQTLEQWQYDLAVILKVQPPSVTTYEYVVHVGTAAERLIAKGRLGRQPSRERKIAWYLRTRDQFIARGYVEAGRHTFFKPGHQQRYSAFTYGLGCELIGLGAKAYSYVNGYQFAAPANVPRYEQLVDAGVFPIMDKTSCPPTSRNLMERHVIFSLRRLSAVDGERFRRRFGQTLDEIFRNEIAKLKTNGTLISTPNGIQLTELGEQWRANVLGTFYDPVFR